MSERDKRAATDKIEVTAEMIEAGVVVMYEVRDLQFETAEDAVKGIVTAVLGSRVVFQERRGQSDK